MKIKAIDRKRGHHDYSILYFSISLLLLIASILSSYFISPGEIETDSATKKLFQNIFSFGFNQIRNVPPIILLQLLIVILALVYLFRKSPDRLLFYWQKVNEKITGSKVKPILFSLIFGIVCFVFSSRYANRDLRYFRIYYPEYSYSSTPFLMFDEMWESYLHHRFYIYTNDLFGWDVDLSMRVFACICAVASIYLIFKIGELLWPTRPLLPFLLMITGGFMQILFGDMEQYPLVTVFVFLFLFSALLFINKKISLLIPSISFLLAITSHFASIYLFPALLFLFIVEMQRRNYYSIIRSIISLLLLFSLIILFFMNQGAFLQRLIDTSWGMGRGGSILSNFVTSFNLNYFLGQINLLLLIFPLIWTLIYLLKSGLIYKLLKRDQSYIFLAIASLSGLIFFFVWKTGIGLYDDWNLFSIMILPVCILISSGLCQLNNFRLKGEWMILAIGWSCISTYAWILNNHFL